MKRKASRFALPRGVISKKTSAPNLGNISTASLSAPIPAPVVEVSSGSASEEEEEAFNSPMQEQTAMDDIMMKKADERPEVFTSTYTPRDVLDLSIDDDLELPSLGAGDTDAVPSLKAKTKVSLSKENNI